MTDLVKSLRVKSGSVKRYVVEIFQYYCVIADPIDSSLGKEFSYYVQEQNSFEQKVEGLREKSDGGEEDAYRLKKTEEQMQETVAAMVDTQKRLQVAFEELQAFLVRGDSILVE